MQLTLNQRVAGSSPAAPTNEINHLSRSPSERFTLTSAAVYTFGSSWFTVRAASSSTIASRARRRFSVYLNAISAVLWLIMLSILYQSRPSSDRARRERIGKFVQCAFIRQPGDAH